MRTTWTTALGAAALVASGLPGLGSAPASAQGIAAGASAPATNAYPYSPPVANGAPSSYIPPASPYNPSARPGGASATAPSPYYPPGAVRTGTAAPGPVPYYPSGAPGGGAAGPRGALASPGVPSPSTPASAPYFPAGAVPGGRAVAPAATSRYSPNTSPASGRVLPGRGRATPSLGSDPSGMRASYANPSAADTSAANSSPATGARGSAFAPDTQPYPEPPKPSRMRRFYNWLTGDDKSGERPIHTYIDRSTGRTDLPMSKPWLKQVW